MDWRWIYGFRTWEGVWLFLFLVAYGLYLGRIWVLASQLQHRRRWAFLKLPLRFFYVFLLLIALWGPGLGTTEQYAETWGKDIFLLVDVSQSMLACDVAPSRIEKIRFELKNLLSELDKDRVGLIAFAGNAFLPCPLTYDLGAVRLFLQTLSAAQASQKGSNLVPPLEMALLRFTEAEEKTHNPHARLVILASDGEHFGPDLLPILEKYQSAKIPIFTIGIGSPSGGPIPLGAGLRLDAQGKTIITRLQTQTLKTIADKTKGNFYLLGQAQNQLSQLAQDLKKLKGYKREEGLIRVSQNAYLYFLWLGLALMALDFILKVRVLRWQG
ncbi:MAG: hypothetical protein OHK0053_24340 [Microscillaceae bacterium]